jgi:hypothetical protein
MRLFSKTDCIKEEEENKKKVDLFLCRPSNEESTISFSE